MHGGAGATGGAEVHLGLWLQIIEGCDYSSTENMSPECQVPVIAEIGHITADGDVDALTPANRLGRMLIENYVPHGYVLLVSVFGTGESNHCMDLMGTDEQRGIDAAVTWLGTQTWSNGNSVGIIGKSYDGSMTTATFGNPHLATIVLNVRTLENYELMWRNGSMEARGMIMHNGVYGSFGIDGVLGMTFALSYIEGYVNGPAAYLSGGMVDYAGNTYWIVDYFLDRVLKATTDRSPLSGMGLEH